MKNASLDEFRQLLDKEEYEFRYDLGIGQVASSVNSSDQMQIVVCMCKHYSNLSIKAELDQILCGLSSTLNMLHLIREYPKMFRPLLVYEKTAKLSGDDLFGTFAPILSPDGSNQREAEELLLMWWADMLYYIEGEIFSSSTIA